MTSRGGTKVLSVNLRQHPSLKEVRSGSRQATSTYKPIKWSDVPSIVEANRTIHKGYEDEVCF